MRRCEKCNVFVRGDEKACPLCQHTLTGTCEEAVYPNLPTVYRQFQLFFKLLIFFTAAAGICCVAVNLILPQSGMWSLFAVLGIVCFWVCLAYAVRKKDNIPEGITKLVVIVSLLALGWDRLTGWHGWSLNFALPFACITAMVSMAVVAKVLRMPAGDYVVFLVADIVFGIVPLVFYLTGLLSYVIPSVLCFALRLLLLSALILFEGKNMLREVQKRFHV